MLYDPLLLLAAGLKLAIAGILLLAAARDIMTRTVPNWIPLTLAVLCTALAIVGFRPIWGLGFGLGVFLFCFFCWRRGWMGGADVKLLGAAAIAIAPSDVEMFLVGISLFGGVLGLIHLAGRFVLPRLPKTCSLTPRSRYLLARVLRVEAWRILRHGPLPYACAIAAGTLFVLS
jgi:prepilin peptidase CpaA